VKDFKTSASDLNTFYECPAKYDFSQRLTPKEVPSFFADGTAAHAILAGEQPYKISPRGRAFANRLKDLYKGMGYSPAVVTEDHKPMVEVRQEVSIGGARFKRIIDAFAFTKDKELVLIDYKTGSAPYIELGGFAPQTMGFQAVAYLVPPRKADNPFKQDWPTRIDFLHAPERGESKVYPYRYDAEDNKNLVQAVNLMKVAVMSTQFPKVRGYHCNNSKVKCPFYEACFETPGWEKLYKKRTK
jgi:CRISPR/Cas system-associated exonuclease Cas4 (RecB family)